MACILWGFLCGIKSFTSFSFRTRCFLILLKRRNRRSVRREKRLIRPFFTFFFANGCFFLGGFPQVWFQLMSIFLYRSAFFREDPPFPVRSVPSIQRAVNRCGNPFFLGPRWYAPARCTFFSARLGLHRHSKFLFYSYAGVACVLLSPFFTLAALNPRLRLCSFPPPNSPDG